MTLIVFLVIQLFFPGHEPITIQDEQMPDLATCWAKASESVERAAIVTGHEPFEFSATCSVAYPGEDPA